MMQLGIMRGLIGLFVMAACAYGTDLTGIWVGQQEGRNGQKEDIAFQFKAAGASITGTMFGDEFDLAIDDVAVSGDQVRFTVTTTNYYSRSKTSYSYTGKLTESTLELVRERVQTQDDRPSNNRRRDGKQTLILKRLT